MKRNSLIKSKRHNFKIIKLQRKIMKLIYKVKYFFNDFYIYLKFIYLIV